jgi:hypothetical protein
MRGRTFSPIRTGGSAPGWSPHLCCPVRQLISWFDSLGARSCPTDSADFNPMEGLRHAKRIDSDPVAAERARQQALRMLLRFDLIERSFKGARAPSNARLLQRWSRYSSSSADALPRVVSAPRPRARRIRVARTVVGCRSRARQREPEPPLPGSLDATLSSTPCRFPKHRLARQAVPRAGSVPGPSADKRAELPSCGQIQNGIRHEQ